MPNKAHQERLGEFKVLLFSAEAPSREIELRIIAASTYDAQVRVLSELGGKVSILACQPAYWEPRHKGIQTFSPISKKDKVVGS